MSKSPETKDHKKLKRTVVQILKNADFEIVDSEINIDIYGNGKTGFSIDVCGIHKETLLVFQCKDRHQINAINAELDSTNDRVRKVLKGKSKILKSDAGSLSDERLRKISSIKCCYAFTDKLSNKDTKENIETAGFVFWNYKAVKYYQRISEILKGLTKNEILKEFDMAFISKTIYRENAVEIKQGDNNLYLLGMHPGLLLKIAYVYRRAGNKSEAYQRIITKDRIQSISKFFNESDNLLLPNPVIIVFDAESDIQNKIKYVRNQLHFPISLCSAWIIDGQHRIYGFKDHPKYKSWTPDDDDDFKIPVVVFKELAVLDQNKTF